MKNKLAYTYVVLRYRHDAIAGESVNVGVVLHCAQTGFLGHKLTLQFGRLRSIFPDLDGDAFRTSIRAVRHGLDTLSRREKADMLSRLETAESHAQAVLPKDDSSFIWGNIGAGLTADPQDEMERLFQRFVTWYEEDKISRRSDSDIWRPVRDKLSDRHLSDRLEATTINSDLTSVKFEHTWKNGALHCYQPLSFDLATEDNIQDKVARWSGHLLHLQDSSEEFVPYFIVGRPSDLSLTDTYQKAIRALKMSPHNPQIYEENQIDELVDLMHDEMLAHDRELGS